MTHRAQMPTGATARPRGRGRGRLHGYEPTERQIQDVICAWLELKGIVHSVTDRSRHWDAKGRVRASRVSMPGYPDISCVIDGKAVFVEVKSKRGKLSPVQVVCHSRLQAAGAVVFVVRSLEELITALNERN